MSTQTNITKINIMPTREATLYQSIDTLNTFTKKKNPLQVKTMITLSRIEFKFFTCPGSLLYQVLLYVI